MRFFMKSESLQDKDGVLSERGNQIAQAYARRWLAGSRDLEAERQHTSLQSIFLDIRGDRQTARDYADPDKVEKSVPRMTVPMDLLFKAGGPYVGPKGGKYRDVERTQGWKEPGAQRGAAKQEEPKPKGKQQEMDLESPHGAKKDGMMSDLGLPEDTKAMFAPGGQYTPDRQALHQRILSDAAAHVPSVPHGQKPTALVTMGGPGSGKTTVVNGILGRRNDFVNANSDNIKEQIPEFQQALQHPTILPKDAAMAVHDESGDINDQLMEHAVGTRKNMIVDGTGQNKAYTMNLISDLKGKGYAVHVAYPHVDVDTAVSRADKRAKGNGRVVHEDKIRALHSIVPGNFEDIARAADSFSMFDNNGSRPELMWSRHGGQEVIHDAGKVGAFKQMASGAKSAHAKRVSGMEKRSADTAAAPAAKPLQKGFQPPKQNKTPPMQQAHMVPPPQQAPAQPGQPMPGKPPMAPPMAGKPGAPPPPGAPQPAMKPAIPGAPMAAKPPTAQVQPGQPQPAPKPIPGAPVGAIKPATPPAAPVPPVAPPMAPAPGQPTGQKSGPGAPGAPPQIPGKAPVSPPPPTGQSSGHPPTPPKAPPMTATPAKAQPKKDPPPGQSGQKKVVKPVVPFPKPVPAPPAPVQVPQPAAQVINAQPPAAPMPGQPGMAPGQHQPAAPAAPKSAIPGAAPAAPGTDPSMGDPAMWPASVTDEDLMRRIAEGGDHVEDQTPPKYPHVTVSGDGPGIIEPVDVT